MRKKPESSRKMKRTVQVRWGKKTTVSYLNDLAKEYDKGPTRNKEGVRTLKSVAKILNKNMTDSKDKLIYLKKPKEVTEKDG